MSRQTTLRLAALAGVLILLGECRLATLTGIGYPTPASDPPQVADQ